MPTFKSFAEFGRAMEDMKKDVDEATARIARTMGEKAQSIAHAEAADSLGGDAAFSGWRRHHHIVLDTKLKSIKFGIVMMPTRESAGPWTVAEFGRNQGNASGFSGPGINTRTGKTSRTKSGGIRKTRARSGKRWNGTTDPKHTASNAVKRMDRELDPIADRGVRRVIVRHFDVT